MEGFWWLGAELAGAFFFSRQIIKDDVWRSLWIHMPYDSAGRHHSIHCLRIYRSGEAKPPTPSWLWDGNEELPTLSPSIACGRPKASNWHGYLKAGVLEACE